MKGLYTEKENGFTICINVHATLRNTLKNSSRFTIMQENIPTLSRT